MVRSLSQQLPIFYHEKLVNLFKTYENLYNTAKLSNKIISTYHMPRAFQHSLRCLKHRTGEIRSHFLWCFLCILQFIHSLHRTKPSQSKHTNKDKTDSIKTYKQGQSLINSYHFLERYLQTKLFGAVTKFACNFPQPSFTTNAIM